MQSLAVLTDVGAVVKGQSTAGAGFHQGSHGGQMAPREDMLPDEVAAAAVRLVPLVWLTDRLHPCSVPHMAKS